MPLTHNIYKVTNSMGAVSAISAVSEEEALIVAKRLGRVINKKRATVEIHEWNEVLITNRSGVIVKELTDPPRFQLFDISGQKFMYPMRRVTRSQRKVKK
jgi:hypothetical protein